MIWNLNRFARSEEQRAARAAAKAAAQACTMPPSETYLQTVWRRFCRHRLALVSLVILALVAGAAVLAPVLAPYDPAAISAEFSAPPSAAHWLGTDQIGRDVLSRLLERPVQWIDDVCGPAAREKISALQNGEILLLDNVR